MTEYGPDLERIHKEKRQYLSQIIRLLGLDDLRGYQSEHPRSGRSPDLPVGEYRQVEDANESPTDEGADPDQDGI